MREIMFLLDDPHLLKHTANLFLSQFNIIYFERTIYPYWHQHSCCCSFPCCFLMVG
jgi:hypothetical protein